MAALDPVAADVMSDAYKEMPSNNIKGLVLGLSSSFFIVASFIVKKKGLKKAGASGVRAVIVGEIANFAAYAFAPAILVTPLAFLFYAALVTAVVLILIFQYIPQYGQTHILFYIGVCSLVGSLSVMSVKALGIVLKLTLSGTNQLIYAQTWTFPMIVTICVLTQMNYLNKALDIYYVMFTSFTILASVIMFKDWDRQNPTQIVTEMCGFINILSGTFLLHKTKDSADGRLPRYADEEDGLVQEGIPLR